MRDKEGSGPWRQDDLEPRIVLDCDGEFFAIGASAREAGRIVAALNQAAAADADRPATGFEDPPGSSIRSHGH